MTTDIFTKYKNSLHSRNRPFTVDNRRKVKDEITNSIKHLLKLSIIHKEEEVFKVKRQILDKIGQIKSEMYYEHLKKINSD